MKGINRYGVQARLHFAPGAFKRLRPTKATIRQMEQTYIDTGKKPPGVTITLTVWGERLTPAQARARLKDAKIFDGAGCPGIVERYHKSGVTMTDHDDAKAPDIGRVYSVAGRLGIRPLWVLEERTRRGWHRTIQWDRKFSPAETVALQLLLGSDPKRESFNLLRILGGAGNNKRWNLLFRGKL